MKETKSDDMKAKKMAGDIGNSANCKDKRCPIHGTLSVRGRRFKGHITKIYGKNVTIEFERFLYFPKYERYAKAKTRLHAHLPDCLVSLVKSGDYIEVGECRPLSKTINHVVINVENKGKPLTNTEKNQN